MGISFENYSEDKWGVTIGANLRGAKMTLENLATSYFDEFAKAPETSFTGISEPGVDSLISSINTYITKAQDTINGFNADIILEKGLKGPALEAAQIFLKAVKDIMTAYVSVLIDEKKELAAIKEKYRAASSDISGLVQDDAKSLRDAAKQIRIDDNSGPVSIDSGQH
ncbi:MAG: hypothetical protein IKX00_04675 [Bacilli bacterium]|nr:hypothetical protein [Bacilli bacterium]